MAASTNSSHQQDERRMSDELFAFKGSLQACGVVRGKESQWGVNISITEKDLHAYPPRIIIIIIIIQHHTSGTQAVHNPITCKGTNKEQS